MVKQVKINELEVLIGLIENVSKKINNQFEIELPTFQILIDNNIFGSDFNIKNLITLKENVISNKNNEYKIYGLVMDITLLEKELKELLNG
jgi:hypothetical protein